MLLQSERHTWVSFRLCSRLHLQGTAHNPGLQDAVAAPPMCGQPNLSGCRADPIRQHPSAGTAATVHATSGAHSSL